MRNLRVYVKSVSLGVVVDGRLTRLALKIARHQWVIAHMEEMGYLTVIVIAMLNAVF